MKERPILFQGEMVRAILDGRKTQTRRVIKIQPSVKDADPLVYSPFHGQFRPASWFDGERAGSWNGGNPIRCPYGHIGDRLWVRETWGVANGLNSVKPNDIHVGIPIIYRASSVRPDDPSMMWRSPYFIKRWMSRLTLEIMDVRVQRVREISEEDCMAEGIEPEENFTVGGNPQGSGYKFRFLWDSINAKRGFGWSANPWVWAVTFRRIE
jgi:hypothetical protein